MSKGFKDIRHVEAPKNLSFQRPSYDALIEPTLMLQCIDL